MEKSFRERGIRCDSLLLSPRLPLAAVIRRQILEGVQAVVKLTRQAQFSGKIPLQVFNRSAGVDNVQFDGKSYSLISLREYSLNRHTEYDDLETHIAAELVVRAKQTHSAPQSAQYGTPQQGYGMPQYAQPISQAVPQQQPPPAAAPNLASLITSLDGPTLQKLLGAMGQSPQTPQMPQQHVSQFQQPVSADLASLLSGAGRQQHQQPSYQQQQQQMPLQGPNTYAANPAYANSPGLATLLGGAAGRQQQAMMPQQQQPQSGHQVQSIMDQLAKWRQ